MARRQFGVGDQRADDLEDPVDRRDPERGVEAMHREQRIEGRMAARHVAVRPGDRAHPVRGIQGGIRKFDRAEHPVDHRVEQVLLAREVVVEAHRLAAQPLAEASGAEGAEPEVADERKRRVDDALAAERQDDRRRGRAAPRHAPPGGSRLHACNLTS